MSDQGDEPRFVDKREGRFDRRQFRPMETAGLPKLGTPPGERTGLLDGFDVLKVELSRVASWAVRGRLKAGQSIDQIRREVPAMAVKTVASRYPNAEGFQESVHAFVARVVEAVMLRELEAGSK